MKEILLEICGLKKHFEMSGGGLVRQKGLIKAVDGVSLQIYRGETLGLVGESGCGKSTLARMIMRLEEPTAGEIKFEGENITALAGGGLKKYRKRVQMIFQDPYSSLNPRKAAGSIIAEPLKVHHRTERDRNNAMLDEISSVVGLDREQLNRYPHEFSGGQRQRIGIARALILKPRLVIADEPVSALDVSIQSQILNLLKRLQRDFALTYLFITHDLGVVHHMSDRIAVMYLGKIVELGGTERICSRPGHPYTRALLSAVPVMDPIRRAKRTVLRGEMPSPAAPPPGCAFHPRCPIKGGICDKLEPPLKQDDEGHWTACHKKL